MDRKHLGARSELIACAWLLSEGYEVFRNISPHGLADLVVDIEGVLRKVDVKTVGGLRSLPNLSRKQHEQGIIMLYVYPNGQCTLVTDPPPLKVWPYCEICDLPFRPKKHDHRFCSYVCRITSNKAQRAAHEAQ